MNKYYHKFTNLQNKMNSVFALKKIIFEDLSAFTYEELKEFHNGLIKKLKSLKGDKKVDEFMKDLIKNHEFEKREDGLYLSIFKIKETGLLIYPEVCDQLKSGMGKPLTMVKMYLKYKNSCRNKN
ncbi:hypothetical protein SAMN05880574_13013 [Chryseobacterium sp. RU37D]|nr:hypothetical protein SAMN05880574_13013 [Chryseobacterium sp. RU37D]